MGEGDSTRGRGTTPSESLGFDDYPRPALAVDPVVLEVADGTLRVAIRRRDVEPQVGTWALPGVFVQHGETLDHAVRRAVDEKCHVPEPAFVEQLFTWDMAGRDPRGWVVAVAYFVVVRPGELRRAGESSDALAIGDVAADIDLDGGSASVRVDGKPVALAFDHEQILGAAVARLRGRLRYSPVAVEFLPELFTLRELQTVYEAILGTAVNKDSFRRHVVSTMKLVEPTGEHERDVPHRPAELYRVRAAATEIV
ncbi:MAG: NUDIX domain-containing protein [Ilumatobacter sp.]